MKILDRLLTRSPLEPANGGPAAPTRSGAQGELPIPGYEDLGEKQLVGQLSRLSQVELAAVEAHERSNRERPAVLAKLHWLRGSEPVDGYDALSTEAAIALLAGADAGTIKGIREYENKFQRRASVLAEIARVLPTAPYSASETRAQDEKAERLRSVVRPGMDA
jgi:hypothetical protein